MIAITVLTLNEEANIAGCLQSIALLTDRLAGQFSVMVVDSGSTDTTIETAHTMGAEVIEQPWLGYVDQRNFALQKAQSAGASWVLFVDADERITESLADELATVMQANTVQGIATKRVNRLHGEIVRSANEHIPRAVRVGHGQWTGGHVHERLSIQGKTYKTSAHLDHNAWPDIQDYFARTDRYATLMAQSKQDGYAGLWLLAKPLWSPIKFLVFRGGIFDGWRGWVFAFAYTGYSYRKVLLRISHRKSIQS